MEKIKSKLILLSCMTIFSLTGCLQKNIIDDVQLIQGTVFDLAKDNKVKVTFVCPIQQKGNKVQVFEGSANAVKQVKADTSLESSQPFASGQMRVALYTIRLAKKGMSTSFDTLIRDVNIGNALYVALLEGNGTDLLKGKYTTASNVAIYMKKLLEHNMETGPLPQDNLHIGAFRYYREGQDYYIPILKKHEDKIKITGIGLFKKDKYIGKITEKDMFIFKGLLEKHRLDSHEFKTDSAYVMINNIRSVPTYDIKIKNGKPSFSIHVKLDARIQELSKPINLENVKNTKKIEKAIQKQLDIQAAKLIKQFKSLGVDPLGLGAKYKQHYRPFKLEEWKKMYKDVPVNVKYTVNITNSGVIE
ncbi:Ger(x)C family spore germination protein [Bacillus cereus]|uniref:Ger(x)C family spore germination protein n=1 Tax=Bacillus nitratireducens TaxID=2026193 RepID=UPI0003010C62|nr:Ger(x)C family spore germination protein [Bacillus nitratireducens]PEB80916.1 Ger(x)C family spore germination protein [Bacillus cereus]OJD54935.1 spore gernimation protein GerH [Bacillus nitratireducens]PEW89234.1 Ger(x)C family spore germination protein [Bacillus cereus]PFH69268.1 Ger(x)C family spore germination protein [Bacillus cereus]PFN76210.1 Ger(x)C family spore germination protein [Bacillus cereus]